jgi:hypothetical protein
MIFYRRYRLLIIVITLDIDTHRHLIRKARK